MKVIPREARKITYSTEIRNLRARLFLNEDQISLIIGGILGDGNLEASSPKTNYRLKFDHSEKQKEYIFWKYGVLKNWVLTPPRYYAPTKAFSFRTFSHREITKLHDIFYHGRIKILPENVGDYLNPKTLAVWFMDDGNIIRRNGKVCGYHINTQSFTKEESIRLIELLRDIYEIIALPELNKGKYRLRIMQRNSRDRFINLIKNYIIPSMYYKIS